MISAIFRLVMWNQTIPTVLRGRVAGIEQISYTSGPLLGNVRAGLVAGPRGVEGSIVSGGVLCIIGSGVIAAALPQLTGFDVRRYRLEQPAKEASPVS